MIENSKNERNELSYQTNLMSTKAAFQEPRKLKFARKFMLIARAVAEDNNACFSRKIGCIIADYTNHIIGMGYNGPPARTPHCDTYEYLANFFLPQLTQDELISLGLKNEIESQDRNDYNLAHDTWAKEMHACGKCPRRLVDAGPGERSTLCSCQHSERNAITNATADIRGSSIYCWCGVPCIDCAGAIINSGIEEVHCLWVDGPDYHPVSRWLLKSAGVELYIYKEQYFEN